MTTKAEQTRRRILDAAADVFASAGLEGASLKEIAGRAGLQAGSLYFHFASKEALLVAVIEESVDRSLERLDAALRDAGEDPRARLRAAVGAHVGAVADFGGYAAVLLHRGSGEADRARAAAERRYRATWLALVESAQAGGALPPEPSANLLVDLLVGAMNSGLGVRGRRSEDPAARAAALTALIESNTC